jgi:hypothetical protein
MKPNLLELYSDYLISSFGQTSATGLSNLLEGEISHDSITRLLSKELLTPKDYWLIVKKTIRQIESDDGVIIIDDSIEEKPYTDENDIICWHYDHCKDRSIKGINFLTAIYYSNGLTIPVTYQLVAKTELVTDKKTGKQKRISPKTKNEYFREMLVSCKQNSIIFRFVISDVWYSSAENMMFIKKNIERDFVMPLKSNRKVALNKTDKLNGRYQALPTVQIEPNTVREIYLEGVDFPMLLLKQVFANADGSTGILYLVTSDSTLDYDLITTIYKRRWKVEEYHKSLKQNASLEKSPTKTVVTQSNHFFASMVAYYKIELLKQVSKCNHFALKAKIYMKALQSAFKELENLKKMYPDITIAVA